MAYILRESTSRIIAYRNGVRGLYTSCIHHKGCENTGTTFASCSHQSISSRLWLVQPDNKANTVHSAKTVCVATYIKLLSHPDFHTLDLRSFHTSALYHKDERVVEKSVKALKSELEKSKEKAENTTLFPVPEQKEAHVQLAEGFLEKKWRNVQAKWIEMKHYGVWLYIKDGAKHMFWHYVNGFRLFWIDLKICLPLLMKYLMKGRSALKRREYKQLTRTLADLVRMFPLIPMLVIPLGEIFIPFYISIGMMPSTFMEKKDVEKTNRVKLQRKIEYGAMLAESLKDVPLQSSHIKEESPFKDFTDFMKRVKSREIMPSTEEIIKFSRLFEDELTLDDLSTVQLQSLCKFLGIGFFAEIPSRRILRFQIGMKLRELEVDDKLIQKEGIDSLAVWELQEANRKRGMRAIGVSEDRLKFQLQQWLDLHLKEEVPTTLLILSRIMFLEEHLTPAEQLKQTLSTLSESTVDKVMVSTAELMGEKVDKETKIRMLKEEQKAIKTEKKQEKAEEMEKLKKQKEMAEAEAKKAAEAEAVRLAEAELFRQTEALKADPLLKLDMVGLEGKLLDQPTDVLPKVDVAKPIVHIEPSKSDMAEAIEVKQTEEVADVAKKEEEDHITSMDLGDIEQAIEELSMHTKYEFEDVKEDLQKYVEGMEDINALMVAKSMPDRVKETRGAMNLRKKLDKYLNDLEKKIDALHEKKVVEQSRLEKQEVELKYDMEGKREQLLQSINEKKRVLINFNEVLLGLRRLQKVPDDVRMQKVLEVLDTDKDGLIDISDVLKVTELLGRENLKMDKSQVSAMMDLLHREEVMEVQEKQERTKNKTELEGDSSHTLSAGDSKKPQSSLDSTKPRDLQDFFKVQSVGDNSAIDTVNERKEGVKQSLDIANGDNRNKDTVNNVINAVASPPSQMDEEKQDTAKTVDSFDSAKTLDHHDSSTSVSNTTNVHSGVKKDSSSQQADLNGSLKKL